MFPVWRRRLDLGYQFVNASCRLYCAFIRLSRKGFDATLWRANIRLAEPAAVFFLGTRLKLQFLIHSISAKPPTTTSATLLQHSSGAMSVAALRQQRWHTAARVGRAEEHQRSRGGARPLPGKPRTHSGSSPHSLTPPSPHPTPTAPLQTPSHPFPSNINTQPASPALFRSEVWKISGGMLELH